MAVAFRAGSTVAEAAAVNATYTAPAGLANGDWIYIAHFEFAASPGTPPTPTSPAGFSLVPLGSWPMSVGDAGGDTGRVWLWHKLAASESGNYTVTHTSATRRGEIFAISGADGTTPEHVLSQNSASAPVAGNPSTATFLSITPTVDACLILAVMVDWNDLATNLTAPTGTTPTFTEQIDDNHGNYLATGVLSPAGATTNKTMATNSSTDPWFAILAAIQPPTSTAAVMPSPRRMTLSM